LTENRGIYQNRGLPLKLIRFLRHGQLLMVHHIHSHIFFQVPQAWQPKKKDKKLRKKNI